MLLGHAATAGSRRAAFPADEPLDAGGRRTAAELAGRLRTPDTVWCGPSPACRATGVLALPDATVPVDDPAEHDPVPAGPDPGAWRGRTPEDLLATEPAELAAWLTESRAAPRGGESTAAFAARVGRWMDALSVPDGGADRRRGPVRRTMLAVVDPPVVRAAVAHALGAGPEALRRIDAGPLWLAELTAHGGRWNLRSLAPADDVLPGPVRPGRRRG